MSDRPARNPRPQRSSADRDRFWSTVMAHDKATATQHPAAERTPATPGSRANAQRAPADGNGRGKTKGKTVGKTGAAGSLRKFGCVICGARFPYKSLLSTHVQSVHEKKKPYKCASCTKMFAKKHDLTTHQNAVHKLQRPYKCDTCGLAFSKRFNLGRHQAKIHGKK